MEQHPPHAAPLNLHQEAFVRGRVMGLTLHQAHESAFPGTVAFEARRKAGFRLEKKPEVQERLAEVRAAAMLSAQETGADLVRTLKEEIDAATTTDTPQAVFESLEELGKAATAAGDLQAAVAVLALRVKMIEVLGRIRLQATSALLKYAAKVKGNGSADTPVRVQINYGLPEAAREGFPLPNPSRS